jgi:cytochrome d ubiquinol oxidase subunit II
MFDSITLLALQEYWWLLVSVLGALFVFMNFIQGGQTLLYTLGKTEDERDLLINSMGRKWELSFTALVMFGGALFAAFPLFYAVSFGGAYYVWMAILFCFIVQAVAYEYRKKPDNFYGKRFYESLLYINGSLGTFLIGVALATLYSGGNFIVDEMNRSRWAVESYGLEALLNPFNVAFGLMLVFLARVQGSLYFINSLDNENIVARARKTVQTNFVFFLVLFLFVMAVVLFANGYKYDATTHIVSVESMKFLYNFLEMPIVLVIFLVGVLSLIYGVFIAAFKHSTQGIWFTGVGTVLAVTMLMAVLGWNNTVYYPSLADLQSSLTIQNSSGSFYTLSVMSIVSLSVPVVLGYIFFVWRAMDKTKLTIDEIKADPHHY